MSDNNINPITQKLLNKKISLKDLTLEKFREGRIIYPTYKKAQAKGFEAHHIIPVSTQTDSNNFDDRCIRYTPFEHIIDHYLLGKKDSKYIYSFECMTRFNFHNLMNDEQKLLESCIEFAELRKQGIEKIREAGLGNHNALGHKLSNESKKKISEANKALYINKPGSRTGHSMPEHVKEILNKVNKGNSYHKGHKHSEETKKKMSEKAKGRKYGPMPEKIKQKLREANTGKIRSAEAREKMSKAKLGKEPWNKGLKGVQKSWNKGMKGAYHLSEEALIKRKEMLIPKQMKYKELKTKGFQGNWNDFQSALKKGEISL